MAAFGREAGPSSSVSGVNPFTNNASKDAGFPSSLTKSATPSQNQFPRVGAFQNSRFISPTPNLHSSDLPQTSWVPEVERVRPPQQRCGDSGVAFGPPQTTEIVSKRLVPGGTRSSPTNLQGSHLSNKVARAGVVPYRPADSPFVWVKEKSYEAKVEQSDVAVRRSHNSDRTVKANDDLQTLKPVAVLSPHTTNEQISSDLRQDLIQRPVLPWSQTRQPRVVSGDPIIVGHEDRTKTLYSDRYDSSNILENREKFDSLNQNGSPFLSSNKNVKEDIGIARKESRIFTSTAPVNTSFVPSMSLKPINITINDADTSMGPTLSAAKRTRALLEIGAEEVDTRHLDFDEYAIEREEQAKAKRLARFKKELEEGNRLVENCRELPNLARVHNNEDSPMEANEDTLDGNRTSDHERIIGICPDMCPESERAERERKGDLDHYERFNGERNQTSRFLAVKKYNRTAERVATLIRPMPVLQETMDYLLGLLNMPYGDRFLSMYNFLWDRMRAIRMDLRMQHLFNQKAITMLEQMIRLHIVAMHELCEYSKGEGFSEGFDAHLNIEQMNKTSVELFQLYDDHRKQGTNIPTEQEFRGYYALLKLDKHPGYNVEPAELSLDLSKMTPETRQNSEVIFARHVARACRTGNFISFFRLARKASYLQVCLMHAHFEKLRTSALSALHSSLQFSQGLPLAHVAQWLALEDEDVESVLDYHGFVIKEFEEPYMVKEGQFLNSDKPYPTRCSKLVHGKRSGKIVDDILQSFHLTCTPMDSMSSQSPMTYKHGIEDTQSTQIMTKHSYVLEELMPDIEQSAPDIDMFAPFPLAPISSQQNASFIEVSDAFISSHDVFVPCSSPLSTDTLGVSKKSDNDGVFTLPSEKKMSSGMVVIPSLWSSNTILDVTAQSSKGVELLPSPAAIKSPVVKVTSDVRQDDEEISSISRNGVLSELGHQASLPMDDDTSKLQQNNDDEVLLNKQKLMIRLWKRRSSKLKEIRHHRQIAAATALSALTPGPIVQHRKFVLPLDSSMFDIDSVLRKRYVNLQESLLAVNISDVVGDILREKSPRSDCLSWKVAMYFSSQNRTARIQGKNMNAELWLKSKLMPFSYEKGSEELLMSSPALTIWKKWSSSVTDINRKCCFTFVKDAVICPMNETIAGAGGILFLVSNHIPWKLQKATLADILFAIPEGASLPLLVLTYSGNKEVTSAIEGLSLYDLDKSRIKSFLVVPLVDNDQLEGADCFFQDVRLREGLQWLAKESPPQPDLFCVRTTQLARSHINHLINALEGHNHDENVPHLCVSAFNNALDLTLRNISDTAAANRSRWPCPEMDLLDDALAKSLAPPIGWSSATTIEALHNGLRACLLPPFPDVSWLNAGTTTCSGIEDLKLDLENHLAKYLAGSCGMMGRTFAAQEAHIMVQSSKLSLRGTSYHILPNWIAIFRRIFNWRLMMLSNDRFSSAYISSTIYTEHITILFDESVGDGTGYATCLSTPPTLDEMIDVAWSSQEFHLNRHRQEVRRNSSPVSTPDYQTSVAKNPTDSSQRTKSDDLAPAVDSATNNRLSRLLERCSLVQNSIDQKLRFYF